MSNKTKKCKEDFKRQLAYAAPFVGFFLSFMIAAIGEWFQWWSL